MRFPTLNISALIGILSTVCLFTYGQPERLVAQKIEEIRKVGVDTIMTYYEFQGVTSYQIKGHYVIGASVYIIWKEKSAYFVAKASDYYDSLAINIFDTLFKTIRLDDFDAYKYLIANLDSIQNQELKAGMIKDTFDGKDTVFKVNSSHDDLAIINILIGKARYAKRITASQLDNGIVLNQDGSVRLKKESVNYEYNINTTVYRLYALIRAAIIELEAKRVFHE